MVGPVESFLSVDIDEVYEEGAIEGWILADEDSFAALDIELFEECDDVFAYLGGVFSFGDFVPCVAIDFDADGVMIFPGVGRLVNDTLVGSGDGAVIDIDHFECYINGFVSQGI